jgi:hypothetical protein
MWSCFKPQNEKNTKAFNDRYSPSSKLLEQRIGQLERDSAKTRQYLDYLDKKVIPLHQRTPSPVTQKVEQTSASLQTSPRYRQLMLEYTTNMDHASNLMMLKAFDLRNANRETQPERGGSWSGVPSRSVPRAQRTSSGKAL